jgi:FPC/CPF motif-containing protein YcgG
MTLMGNESIKNIGIESWKQDAMAKFQAKLLDKKALFPCIPAKQGLQLNHFRYGFVTDPRSNASSKQLASLLAEYGSISKNLGNYTSLIVFYETPKELVEKMSVKGFETLFWEQLIQVSKEDKEEWPKEIPIDPDHSLWEYCFHGERYFMYYATPAHKNRKSRYFAYFMLAITPRWVLEAFNASPKSAEKIKSKIRKRLENYDDVPIHPDLNSYGRQDNYEWKQYFLYDEGSSSPGCPFHQPIDNKTII